MFNKHNIINLMILAGAITVIVASLIFGLSAPELRVFVVIFLIPTSFASREIRAIRPSCCKVSPRATSNFPSF